MCPPHSPEPPPRPPAPADAGAANPAYGRVTAAAIDELVRAIGAAAVCADRERLAACATDESTLVFPPELLVEPATTEQVSEVMRWASRHRIPVTPRAAASNVTGGVLPVLGGVVLSVMKMNRILTLDERNLQAVVEPGVITHDLQRAAEEHGLFYPPDPSSFEICTIGGNVAVGAGGPHCLKYGTTKDYVLGLTVVLPGGEILETGGRTRKRAAGYDLTHLFVGSEGTLGVLTRIRLRLVPQPKAAVMLLVPFARLGDAVAGAAAILRRGIVPAALELSRGSVLLPPGPDGQALAGRTEAVLLIELDGHPASLEAERDEVGEVCADAGGLDVFVVDDGAKRKAVWDRRRASWPRLVDGNAVIETLDPVVPLDRIVEYMAAVEAIRDRHQVPVYCGGHAGDGNIHTNIACKTDGPEVRARMGRAADEITALTLALGGTVAGEHGIGCVKTDALARELSPVALALQRAIKRQVDPQDIMNPGKVLPDARVDCAPFIAGRLTV